MFPSAFAADAATATGDASKLGTYSQAVVEVNGKVLTIINAYTQYHWRGPGRLVDYDAIRQIFRRVKREYGGKRIGYSAIGAGLAKGDWSVIAAIIEDELAGEDHVFVEWEK